MITLRPYQLVSAMLLSAYLLFPMPAFAKTKLFWWGAASFLTKRGCTLSEYTIDNIRFIAAHCEDSPGSELYGYVTPLFPYHGTPITFELSVMNDGLMPMGSFALRFSVKCGDLGDETIPWGISTGVIIGLSTQYQIEEFKSQHITPMGVCGKGIPIFWRAVVDEINTMDAARTYVLGVKMELEDASATPIESGPYIEYPSDRDELR